MKVIITNDRKFKKTLIAKVIQRFALFFDPICSTLTRIFSDLLRFYDNPPAFYWGPPPLPEQPHSFQDALRSHALSSTSSLLPISDPTLLPPSASNHTGFRKGKLEIFFPTVQVSDFTKPYDHTLIGKFSVGYNKENPSLGRSSLERLTKYFETLDLKREFQFGLLDNRHVLIQISHHLDYLRLYSHAVWYVGSMLMRIFKWSSSFHVDKESSLAPVWASMPRLPIHFFNRLAMYGIVSLLGVPLRLDNATISLKHPSMSRVQVELDVLRDHPEKVWIGVGEQEGFW